MRKFFVFILTASLCFQIFGQQSHEFPALEPNVQFNLPSGKLSSRQIIQIGLAFSEYPAITDFSKYMAAYDELEKRVSTKYFKSLSPAEQAEEILLIMYEKTLRRYELKQTKITKMFDEGTYNCVAASVLYMALAKAAGLNVIGNRAPDHCFCSVIIDGVKYDVETTNPMGFNPGEKKMVAQNGSGTKYAVVPKKTYTGRYEVSDKMLVSLVARNVVAFQMDKKNYSVAVPVSVSRMVFMEDESSNPHYDCRMDFDLVVSNYAAELQRKKMFYESMLWIDKAVERWGISSGLKQNYGDAIYNAVFYLCNNGDADSAKRDLENHKAYVTAKDYEELSGAVITSKAIADVEKIESFDEKISYIKNVKKQNAEKSVLSKLNVLMENIWIKRIAVEANAGRFLEAAVLCDKALVDLPSSSNLRKLKQGNISNYDVTVHNKFAELANKKNFSEARKVLNEGLKNHPDSVTLKNDLNRLNKMDN